MAETRPAVRPGPPDKEVDQHRDAAAHEVFQAAGVRSVVMVPRSVYPKGYRVNSRQGVRVVSKPNAPRLVLEQCRSPRQVVVRTR